MRHFQESTAGSVRKHKKSGHWQGLIQYRDDVIDAEGNHGLTPWRCLTKILSPKCYVDSERGKKAALTELRQWREEVEHAEKERQKQKAISGLNSPQSAPLTLEVCIDNYLEDRLPGKKTIEASTMSGYRRRAKYIKMRSIAQIPISDLTVLDIENFKKDLSKSVKEYSVHDTLALLKAVLKDCVHLGLIEKNPAEDVVAPIPKREDPNVLTESEYRLLLDDLNSTRGRADTPCVLATQIALRTGMRQAEICGLQWRDVDLDKRIIHVRRSVGRSDNGPYLKPKDPRETFLFLLPS